MCLKIDTVEPCFLYGFQVQEYNRSYGFWQVSLIISVWWLNELFSPWIHSFIHSFRLNVRWNVNPVEHHHLPIIPLAYQYETASQSYRDLGYCSFDSRQWSSGERRSQAYVWTQPSLQTRQPQLVEHSTDSPPWRIEPYKGQASVSSIWRVSTYDYGFRNQKLLKSIPSHPHQVYHWVSSRCRWDLRVPFWGSTRTCSVEQISPGTCCSTTQSPT